MQPGGERPFSTPPVRAQAPPLKQIARVQRGEVIHMYTHTCTHIHTLMHGTLHLWPQVRQEHVVNARMSAAQAVQAIKGERAVPDGCMRGCPPSSQGAMRAGAGPHISTLGVTPLPRPRSAVLLSAASA